MDISLLKTFLVLAQTKNFTKAANKLYRSQSAISLQIGRLEALLGKALFVRDQRHVSLTVEGEELVAYAKHMLQLEEKMLKHFQKPHIKGKVTFGTPEDLATVYLPGILANFVDTYPEVLIDVRCEFTLDLLKGFDQGLYDLVLIKQAPNHQHPRSQEVWKETLVWVGSKTSFPYLKKAGECIPLILAPSPCVYRERAIDALNREKIPWRMVYTSPSLTGTLAAVKAGLGLSVLPMNMIPKELCIIKDLPPLQDAQIALLKQESPTDAVSAFSEFVVHNLKA